MISDNIYLCRMAAVISDYIFFVNVKMIKQNNIQKIPTEPRVQGAWAWNSSCPISIEIPIELNGLNVPILKNLHK